MASNVDQLELEREISRVLTGLLGGLRRAESGVVTGYWVKQLIRLDLNLSEGAAREVTVSSQDQNAGWAQPSPNSMIARGKPPWSGEE